MRMPIKTETALRESIEHWKRLSSGKLNKGEDIGPDHCSLCKLFWGNKLRGVDDCNGCPVYARTNLKYCVATPFDAADTEAIISGITSDDFKKIANLELEFLQSLLPVKP